MKNELRRARMSSSTNYCAGGTNTLLHRPKKKTCQATYVHGWQEIGQSFSRLPVLRFHPPFYILASRMLFFFLAAKTVLLVVRLKSSFFDTVWVYRNSRNAFRGTFGLVFGETNSKYSFDHDKLAFTWKRLHSTCSVCYLSPLFS